MVPELCPGFSVSGEGALPEPFLNSAHAQDRTFLKQAIEAGEARLEHWDGSGYPSGLQGEEISPPRSRLLRSRRL
jgi:response regulator RpfG family c-di-GMP phosphodiesterase